VQRLRAEFGPLRLALVRLQEDTGRAGSLKELHAAKTRFRQVLADIRATPGSSTAVVDQALDLVPVVASALTNPLDVTAYSASLVTTPQDWVRRWWQRRPYRLVFGLRDRLLAVRDYGGLLADGAGLHIDPAELTAFATDYEQYLAHFATYGPARRPA
jgi:hypothetical protein